MAILKVCQKLKKNYRWVASAWNKIEQAFLINLKLLQCGGCEDYKYITSTRLPHFYDSLAMYIFKDL